MKQEQAVSRDTFITDIIYLYFYIEMRSVTTMNG